MDSNVWGAGGLFEKALERKMENTAANTALTNSRVGVDMLNSDRNYELGLRSANTADATARTGQFNADTQRVTALNTQWRTGAPNAQTISELGLSTLSPAQAAPVGLRGLMQPSSSMAASKPLEMSAPAGLPSGITKVTTPGMSPFGGGSVEYTNMDPITTGTVPQNMQSDRTRPMSITDKRTNNGLRNGGVVMKPKMVKQPGYKHGGKIEMPKGYAAGGRIGHAKNDDGTDKVPVMARHGEYYLSPNFVRDAFGRGSYDQGVRVLDQAVRDFTGKEPGPVPVGKSGKPGFVDSGAFDMNNYDPNDPRRYNARTPMKGRELVPYRPQAVVPAGPVISTLPPPGTAVVPAGPLNNGSRPNWTPGMSNPQFNSMPPNAGPPTRAYAFGQNLGAKVAPTLRTAAGVAKAAGPGALVTAPLTGFFDYEIDDGIDSSLPGTVKYALRGEGENVLRSLQKGAVETGLDSMSGLAKVIDFVTGLVGANQDLSGKLRNAVRSDFGGQLKMTDAEKAQASAANLEAAKKSGALEPTETEKQRSTALTTPLPPSVTARKEPTLRDMMMEEYRGLREALPNLSQTQQAGVLIQMRDLEKTLDSIDARAAAGAGKKGDSDGDRVKLMEELLKSSFRKPKLDKDGKPTGSDEFDHAEFDEFRASVIAPLAEQGKDFFALPPAKQMEAMRDYKDRRAASDAVYTSLGGLRNAPVSRNLIQPSQISEGPSLGLRQLIDPNSSVRFGNYWDSLWNGGDYDQTANVQFENGVFNVPKTTLTRDAQGRVLLDVRRQYNQK